MSVFTTLTKQKLSWRAPETTDTRTRAVYTNVVKSSYIPFVPDVEVDFLFSDGLDFLFSDGTDYLFKA